MPFPPSINRIYRAVGGRVLLALVARLYHRKAQNALIHLPVNPIKAPVVVVINLHPPFNLVNKKWDIANREKCLCDALTKQKIWVDDSQIEEILIRRNVKLVNIPDGIAHVTITWLE